MPDQPISAAAQAGYEAGTPLRHPRVAWTNAITSCPVESTARCFATAAEAFAAMVSERPYNNTMLSVSWCEDDHTSPGATEQE